ncbi:MAG: YtfJ family protein [bacterium]
MDKKLLSITALATIFCTLFLPEISIAEDLIIGTAAPFFKVESGDDKILTLDMIKGKIIVIFYEAKDVVKKNRKLKDELNKFYFEQLDLVKKLIIRLPVINCQGAFWPFTGIWKSKLRQNSKKEGMTIYGDWDGKMNSCYKMKDNESNVIIIDQKGIIRYIASGKVEDTEISKIKELLKRVGNEK